MEGETKKGRKERKGRDEEREYGMKEGRKKGKGEERKEWNKRLKKGRKGEGGRQDEIKD